MTTIVLTIHIIVSLALIIIVLLQAGKGAEMGAAFGGASKTVFGPRGAAGPLAKVTVGAAVMFMLTSIYLTRAPKMRAQPTMPTTPAGTAQPATPTPGQGTATIPLTPPNPGGQAPMSSPAVPPESPMSPAPVAPAPGNTPAPQPGAPPPGNAPPGGP